MVQRANIRRRGEPTANVEPGSDGLSHPVPPLVVARTLLAVNMCIELKHETEWKKPIQAYTWTKKRGKIKRIHHFFAEWNTFEEAIKWLSRAHHCPIIINEQSEMALL